MTLRDESPDPGLSSGLRRTAGATADSDRGEPVEPRASASRTDRSSPANTGIPRNSGIDLLRGLSILLVVLHHIGLRIALRKTEVGAFLPKWFLNGLNYNGYESVFVFFVISGFLIAGHTLRRWGTPGAIDAKAFYARRFARIVPCLVALVAVLGACHVLGFDGFVIDKPGQSLATATVAALGLHLNWYEGQFGYLPGYWDVLWSLSIEEVFYLGFPIACLFTRRAAVLAPLLVLFALSLPIAHAWYADNEIWQEKAYLPGMAAIATGVLAALVASRRDLPRKVFATALCLAGSAGLASILFIEDILWDAWNDWTLLLLTFSIACLLVGLDWRARWGASRPLRGLGWLRSFGRLSYEIYLTHMFVVFAAVRMWKAYGSELSHGWLWYLPTVPLCWLLGWVVSRWFSEPCDIALRQRLLSRRPTGEGGVTSTGEGKSPARPPPSEASVDIG